MGTLTLSLDDLALSDAGIRPEMHAATVSDISCRTLWSAPACPPWVRPAEHVQEQLHLRERAAEPLPALAEAVSAEPQGHPELSARSVSEHLFQGCRHGHVDSLEFVRPDADLEERRTRSLRPTDGDGCAYEAIPERDAEAGLHRMNGRETVGHGPGGRPFPRGLTMGP
jgi:hypothetical protein